MSMINPERQYVVRRMKQFHETHQGNKKTVNSVDRNWIVKSKLIITIFIVFDNRNLSGD